MAQAYGFGGVFGILPTSTIRIHSDRSRSIAFAAAENCRQSASLMRIQICRVSFFFGFFPLAMDKAYRRNAAQVNDYFERMMNECSSEEGRGAEAPRSVRWWLEEPLGCWS